MRLLQGSQGLRAAIERTLKTDSVEIGADFRGDRLHLISLHTVPILPAQPVIEACARRQLPETTELSEIRPSHTGMPVRGSVPHRMMHG